MQFPGEGKPALGIVFDCDMGQRIDTALALALLYGLEGKREARVVAVSVAKSNLKSAALCDVVGRFYAGAVSGAFGFSGRSLPTGLATNGKLAEDTPMLAVTAKYEHGIHHLNDTADPAPVIRNAFTAQQDQNSAVVLAGPATNLAAALALPGVKDLVTRKVRHLVVSAGAFTGNAPDPRLAVDVPSARKLLADWPASIFFAGSEIGDAIPFPAESIEKDFAWSTAHPVADAYRAHRAMPYDAPSADLAAVLHAVRASDSPFQTSEPGTVQVLDDGRVKFTPAPSGKHRYLVLDPPQKDRILQTYREVASAKPVPRQPRFRKKV